MKYLICTLAFLVAFGATSKVSANPTPVELELSLVVDVSGSINTTEYNLQVQGYVNAFNSPAISQLFTATNNVAINMIMFSTSSAQVLPWRELSSAADSFALASDIATLLTTGSAGRPDNLGTWTDIEDGVTRAIFGGVYAADGTPPSTGPEGILGNDFEGERKVIDVSGDGGQNHSKGFIFQQQRIENGTVPQQRGGGFFLGNGIPSNSFQGVTGTEVIEAARNDASTNGITINGLAITADVSNLDDYFRDHVVTPGSPGGFVLRADDFDDFERAISQKIFAEVGPGPGVVPEPSSIAIFGLGAIFLTVGANRRRRDRKESKDN